MTILHLISTLDVGGGETDLFKLVTQMDRKLFNNIVVSMTNIGPIGRMIQENGIEVHSLNMKKGFPDPKGLWPLHKLIRRYNPSIIHCWMYHANILGLFFSLRRTVIWSILSSYVDLTKYGAVYNWTVKLGALFSKIPSVVVTNSLSGKSQHETLGYYPRRWEVIQNGFDTANFRPDANARNQIRKKIGIPEDAVVIGLVARLDPMKDHRTFFQAAGKFSRKYPDVYFILAGKGVVNENPEIQTFMVDITSSEQFRFIGERIDINLIYSAMDVFTLSSYGEGFPNVIGEAMSTGVPCVVTDVGDSRCIVEDTGIVVPKKDPVALASAWIRLIDNPSLRLTMGKAARDRIEKHYSLRAFVQSYEDLYNSF